MKSRMTLLLLILSVSSGTAWAQTQICVPQFADGTAGPYRWTTTLIFQNQDSTPAQVQAQFYGPFGQMMMNGRGFGGHYQFGPTGMFSPAPIGAGAMAAYGSGGVGSLRSGFCVLTSTNRIQAQVMFHLHDEFGRLLSETGIVPPGTFTTATFFVDHTEAGRVGVAIANPSANSANVTFEIFSQGGTTVLASTAIQLEPHTHFTRFVDELFPGVLTDSVGYVRISSTFSICALALRIKDTTVAPVAFFVNQ